MAVWPSVASEEPPSTDPPKRDRTPRLSKIAEWRDFVDECVVELKKVTWPDRTQAINATWVIIIFVFMVSAAIWFMDIVVRAIVNGIMGLFGA